MEKCPIEICHQIFRAACVDGGKTGIALSLVSRYVNQMSREVKYHSVTVIGLDQIMTFAKVLKDLPPRYRVVRHLFLSSMPQKTDPNDDITPTLNQEIGQVGAEKHYVSFFFWGGTTHAFLFLLTFTLLFLGGCLRRFQSHLGTVSAHSFVILPGISYSPDRQHAPSFSAHVGGAHCPWSISRCVKS